MIKLIDRYGIEIVKKRKRISYYSPELKQEIIDKVLLEGVHKIRVLWIMLFQVVDYFRIGWHNIRKTGILLLRKQEGDHLKWDVSQRRNLKI